LEQARRDQANAFRNRTIWREQQMPPALLATRRSRANATAALLLALAVLTCALPLLLLLRLAQPAGAAACRAIPAAHRALLTAVLASPRVADPLTSRRAPDADALQAAARARIASARLHALLGTCGARSGAAVVPIERAARQALEFATLARYPVDGVMQYLLGLIGVRSKTVVELDGSPGAGCFFGSAALAMYNGFSALVVHALWSGYNQAQSYYEGSSGMLVGNNATMFRKTHFPDASLRLSEDAVTATTVDEVVRRNAYGGEVDAMFAMLDGGEYVVWEKVAVVVPRLVLMFYQDYWGSEARLVRSMNESLSSTAGETDAADTCRRRLYVGASVAAFVELGRRKGYRLAWCLRSAPIAIFVHIDEPFLPQITPADCLASRKSKVWQRDMEAQWQSAQRFSWTEV
jgi:hypothetical protein